MVLRFFTCLLLLCISAGFLRAQDTIVRTDSSRITAKVQKVSATEVEYKKFDNPDGPLYTIQSSQIARIRYSNGSLDVFIQPKNNPVKSGKGKSDPGPKITPSRSSLRHSITANGFDLMFGLFTINYMVNPKDDRFALRFPISTSAKNLSGVPSAGMPYSELEKYYSRYKIFSAGVDFLSFPNGQKFTSFYLGPSLEGGSYYYFQYAGYGGQTTRKSDTFVSVAMTSGVLIRPLNNMDAMIDMTFGMSHASRKQTYDPMLRIGLSMGWRF